MNLSLARSFGRARWRVLDFEVSGCAAIRRMDGDDPLAEACRRLIANRSAWMPT